MTVMATQIQISFSTVAFGNTSTTESVSKRNNHIGKQAWIKDVVYRRIRHKFRQRALQILVQKGKRHIQAEALQIPVQKGKHERNLA